MKRIILSLIAVALLLPAFTSKTQAQDRRTELGERQRLVIRKMEELERKIVIIAEKIAAEDPERAKRLTDTLNKAKDLLITQKMKKVSELLDNAPV